MKHVEAVMMALINSGARRATKFVSPTEVVRVTRIMYRGKNGLRRIDGREKATHFMMTIGRPNHLDRVFIKQCKKAGEPFPVKKIKLSFPQAHTCAYMKRLRAERALKRKH